MADWELQCIQEWRESNPDTKQPTFEDAKKIVSGVLAGLDLTPIPRRGQRIGEWWLAIKGRLGRGTGR